MKRDICALPKDVDVVLISASGNLRIVYIVKSV
jgi:hypothetical protein